MQEKQFRLSMSSMKNQISEVINEDLEESIKSNTGRNTPVQTPKENTQNSVRMSESKRLSVERIEKKSELEQPIDILEMEHEITTVPEEDD